MNNDDILTEIENLEKEIEKLDCEKYSNHSLEVDSIDTGVVSMIYAFFKQMRKELSETFFVRDFIMNEDIINYAKAADEEINEMEFLLLTFIHDKFINKFYLHPAVSYSRKYHLEKKLSYFHSQLIKRKKK